MILSDSQTLLQEYFTQLQNKITSLNISIELEKSICNDLKQIEQIILLQHHQLSFFNERNMLGVILWNTNFEVTDWNYAAFKIFGYTKQEALGHHAAGLLVPESARELVNQVMVDLLNQEGGTHSINNNFTKDGKIITCKWYNMPITDLQGNVIGVISTVDDITANQAMEIALNRSEARFKKLVENVPGVIYQFSLEPDGTISFPYISDACQELFGIEAASRRQSYT